jgi:uncharacterized protein with ATP-grasp and redox domains
MLECIPCFVRQALNGSSMAASDPAVHERIVRETLSLLAETPLDRPPPEIGGRIHRLVRQITGDLDPYRAAKRDANAMSLALYPTLKAQVHAAGDPFTAAVRFAIAGNVIDFGQGSRVAQDEIRRTIEEALQVPLNPAVMEALRQGAGRAERILYLADNAGEIVFDRLLIEQLPLDRLMVVVRQSPTINDATREDAEAAGLTSLVNVIDNGTDLPGTVLESCSETFRTAFEASDLVIAKGQGNFETLGERCPGAFFLFKVKCRVIARHVGTEMGRLVLRRGDGPCKPPV